VFEFFIENLIYAFKSLLQHKVRSFLTMLGIIFGVGAVIAMLAIGKGAEYEAIEQIKAFGVNNIRIVASELSKDDQQKADRTLSKGLSYEDAIYIKKILPYVEGIAPQNLLDKQVYYKEFKPKANVVGTTPEYLYVTSLGLERGRFIEDEDLLEYRKVCILGYGLVREMFLKEDPIGKLITIEGVRFRVVGILSDKSKTKEKVKIKSRDVNMDVYIPITTSIKKFIITDDADNIKNKINYGVVDEIAVRISDSSKLVEAKNAITRILDKRHENMKDYETIVPTELLEQSQKTQKLFNLVMACIAGLSLLVGGIGIMNIMLANVTERTKEIGIRRAIGASAKDIMIFFLLEALLISIIGGIVGIFVGIGIGQIITFYAGWKIVVTIESVILSFGVASSVGIFFGFYPAYTASKMDPIQALRYE